MKLIPLAYLIFISCHHNASDETMDTKLPTCIQNIVDDKLLSESLKTIRLQKVKGEQYYWLNTDARQFDGPEYIVNLKCDTICRFCGFCEPYVCINDYDENWQIIWQK